MIIVYEFSNAWTLALDIVTKWIVFFDLFPYPSPGRQVRRRERRQGATRVLRPECGCSILSGNTMGHSKSGFPTAWIFESAKTLISRILKAPGIKVVYMLRICTNYVSPNESRNAWQLYCVCCLLEFVGSSYATLARENLANLTLTWVVILKTHVWMCWSTQCGFKGHK